MISENKIQAEIYRWFSNEYCLKHHVPKLSIFSVPNGGTRNKAEAMQLKATGLKAGVSDLIVLLPNKCLFVEIKTLKGKQSEKQQNFKNTVEALGFEYYIIRSLEEFKELINNKTK